MCDFGYSERRYWIRRIEAYKKEMEQEELERQRKAAAPAKPAQPAPGAIRPEALTA
jgi:hypothetical protein